MYEPVSFLTDDEPEGPECVRLHIQAADDYYISISRSERIPMGPSFRACTSGARDRRVTYLFAALYKLGRGDLKGAAAAAKTFVEECERG